ncbi:MAG: hypothetical protein RLZZ15_4169, partial [Verrucomicrobiota bacterium]
MSAAPSRGRGAPPRFPAPAALAFTTLVAFALLAGCAHHPVTLYSENDRYFAGTDRHYTNGAKLTVTQPAPQKSGVAHALDALGRSLRRFEPYDVSHEKVDHKLSYSLGQNIYTPTEIHTTAPQPNDRPYAAWLYGGIAFQRQQDDLFQAIELQLGVIGPMALGRQIQNGVHDFLHIARADGWGHQLRNEPGVNLAYDWRYRARRDSTSTQPDTGFSYDVIRRLGLN